MSTFLLQKVYFILIHLRNIMFRLFMLFALAILSISVLYSQVPVKRTDFTFTVSDGTKLDCTKFIPDSVAANLKWPVIIYIHGYGDSKYAELDNAKEQAEYGYYTLVYSVRGQGASTGLSNLISRTEMHDLFEIVDFVKKDTLADSTHFGIYGASQGGILPFMAVCNGLKVTMVMSDLASPEFASSWIENGSIKMTAFFSVDYDTFQKHMLRPSPNGIVFQILINNKMFLIFSMHRFQ